jgi:hypothetical protein
LEQKQEAKPKQKCGKISLSKLPVTGPKVFGRERELEILDKAGRLAQLVQKEKCLLILDGLEPLQYPPVTRVCV